MKVINLPGTREKYGEVLAATFKELREYMRDNVVSVSKVTEEEPLRELLLPRDAATRLCFFSLPLELLPFYRERVFPAVQEAGFVPVTGDDIVTPGDSVSAKIDMLIDRSSVMVVEIRSSWTRAEYRMALARIKEGQPDEGQPDPAERKQLRLIVVTTESERVSRAGTDGIWVILRPNIVSEDPETFVQELANALKTLGVEVGGSRQAEPERLLEAKEYRAAVISAMSLLEARLRKRLNKSPWPQVRNPISMQSLLGMAREQQLLTHPNAAKLDGWMRVRNEIVHSSKDVSRAQAAEIINGVLGLIGQLE